MIENDKSCVVRHRRTLVAAMLLMCVGTATAQQPVDEPKNIVREGQLAERFDAGRKWAVVIGVNTYLDPKIPNLRFCVADARLMADTLAAKCGYDARRILLIADDQPQDHLRPLGINLRNQIAGWLKHAAPGDTVLVFFSGHGFLDDRGQGFLAPKDCEKDHLGLSGFRTDDLRDMLQQCRATQKLLVLDCCHAGGAKSLDDAGPSGQEMGMAFQKAEGLITLASCRRKEQSQEWAQKGQGLFTYFLAQGLQGRADYDGNRLVDSDELYRYAVDRVPTTAQRELNARQTPVRLIGEDVVGVFALSRPSAVESGALPKRLANRLGMEFVLIPAGRFTMGSPPDKGLENERPAHRVEISSPFYMSRTEVTQQQYRTVMGTNPSYFCATGKGARKAAGEDTADFPVESVSHDAAVKFCQRLTELERAHRGTYRLPTEAEWEYAARAGRDGPDDLTPAGWYRDNASGRTHRVAQKAAGGFGLYDTAGNVWEWCSDWYDPGYYARSALRDPAGPAAPSTPAMRVLRGGSWIASATGCRTRDRYASEPDDAQNCYGFRVVRVAIHQIENLPGPNLLRPGANPD
jgi:formylglycine-generating enzyme required for sulfatase activity